MSEFEYYVVASIEELKEGKSLLVEIGEERILLYNYQGHYYAIGDVCTHDYGPLHEGDVEGYEIICPRHGARFDIRTGKVLSLPAVVDIPTYPTRIRDGNLEVGIPKD